MLSPWALGLSHASSGFLWALIRREDTETEGRCPRDDAAEIVVICPQGSPRISQDRWSPGGRREDGQSPLQSLHRESPCRRFQTVSSKPQLCEATRVRSFVVAAPASPLSLCRVPGNTHTLLAPVNPAGRNDPQGSPPLTLPPKPGVSSSALFTSWGQ